MTIILLALASLVALASWATATGGRARRQAHRVARTVDLELAGELGDRVQVRLARRERFGALGALAGAWGAAALGLGLGVSTLGPPAEGSAPELGPALVLVGFFAGHAAGYAVAAWRETARPVGGGPRLARATAPGHEDYVHPVERRGAWVMAATPGLLTIALVLAQEGRLVELPGVPWPALLAVSAGSLAAMAVNEALARRLVARPQVAASPLELAWDDALRSRTLRDLVTATLVLGSVGSVVVLGLAGEPLEGGWPANPAVGLVSGLFFLLALGLGAALVASLAVGPAAHVRRRLWPTGQGVRR